MNPRKSANAETLTSAFHILNIVDPAMTPRLRTRPPVAVVPLMGVWCVRAEFRAGSVVVLVGNALIDKIFYREGGCGRRFGWFWLNCCSVLFLDCAGGTGSEADWRELIWLSALCLLRRNLFVWSDGVLEFALVSQPIKRVSFALRTRIAGAGFGWREGYEHNMRKGLDDGFG